MSASRPVFRALLALVVAAPVVWIYSTRLADAPVHLHHDEVLVALNADAIARTGRAPSGDWMPLYFHVIGDLWQTPISIYATALGFTVLPVSETTVRLPSVVVGLVTIVLTWFLAKRVFKSDALAFVAAGLLALTPSFFIQSRLGLDHHYPALFVTAWLLGLATFLEVPRLRTLFGATLALGVGVYSYFASLLLMPVYFVLTCLQLFERFRLSLRVYLVAAAGFGLPLLLLAKWMASHPSQYSQHVSMYKLYDPKLNPLQGLRELMSYTSLTERVSVYYTYFNPSFLFFAGDTSLIHSTRLAGVFLFPVAVFLALGIYRIVTARRSSFELLILAGFLAAPLAGAVVAEYYRISRAFVMLPFAILLATIGIEYIVQSRRLLWQALAVALLVYAPIQFSQFFRDYMTDYRARSAGWFEGNIGGALEEVIAREPSGAPRVVYVGNDIAWADSFWQFYAIKHGRRDLVPHILHFEPRTFDPDAIPPGSFVVSRYGNDEAAALKKGGLREVRLVKEPNDTITFVVCEK